MERGDGSVFERANRLDLVGAIAARAGESPERVAAMVRAAGDQFAGRLSRDELRTLREASDAIEVWDDRERMIVVMLSLARLAMRVWPLVCGESADGQDWRADLGAAVLLVGAFKAVVTRLAELAQATPADDERRTRLEWLARKHAKFVGMIDGAMTSLDNGIAVLEFIGEHGLAGASDRFGIAQTAIVAQKACCFAAMVRNQAQLGVMIERMNVGLPAVPDEGEL